MAGPSDAGGVDCANARGQSIKPVAARAVTRTEQPAARRNMCIVLRSITQVRESELLRRSFRRRVDQPYLVVLRRADRAAATAAGAVQVFVEGLGVAGVLE